MIITRQKLFNLITVFLFRNFVTIIFMLNSNERQKFGRFKKNCDNRFKITMYDSIHHSQQLLCLHLQKRTLHTLEMSFTTFLKLLILLKSH